MSAIIMNTTPARTLKSLRQLLGNVFAQTSDGDVLVSDITLDSRAVTPGAAFIALRGLRTHGLEFAEQAVANGASVILYEPDANISAPSCAGVLTVVVPSLSTQLGAIADAFFDSPSAAMKVIGVTGTNGKTTSAYLLPEALAALHKSAGYAGTLGYGHVGALKHSAHTTADCITVHRQLAVMRDAGDAFVGMEVSSHALDQGRIDGVRIHSALFTNLTRDHLDYHGTLEAYGAAKEKLFVRPELQHAVINADDEFGRGMLSRLIQRTSRPTLTSFAKSTQHRSLGDRQIFATEVALDVRGVRIAFDGSWGNGLIQSQLIGSFNAENILGVCAVLLGLGVDKAAVISALEQCVAPPGRMETLTVAHRPKVVIDYAHTPDALAKALQTARAHTRGKLICVFGCGGDRDAGKRPLMGSIAEQHADLVVITDDNPRMEDGDAIVSDILQGFDQPRTPYIERDRARAIAYAIRAGGADDVVLIAGKGHEDYQIIGRNVKHFSDRQEAAQCLGVTL